MKRLRKIVPAVILCVLAALTLTTCGTRENTPKTGFYTAEEENAHTGEISGVLGDD